MKLSAKYRPASLSDIMGQPPVRILRQLAAAPYGSCWLLEGPPGVGKTASAYALAAELGCEDEWSGCYTVIASELGVDKARDLFERTLWTRPMQGNGWKVLVIEELETLSQATQVYLKVMLEHKIPPKVIVVATSNGAGKLSDALLERFTILRYGAGPTLAASVTESLVAIWAKEFGGVMPAGTDKFGWHGETFSVRKALDQMQVAGMSR